MKIYVQHNGEECGPYSLDEIRASLRARALSRNDLAWHEGLDAWTPLGDVLFGLQDSVVKVTTAAVEPQRIAASPKATRPATSRTSRRAILIAGGALALIALSFTGGRFFASREQRRTGQDSLSRDFASEKPPARLAETPLHLPKPIPRKLELREIAAKARAAVGLVLVYDGDGETMATGSGFFVADTGLFVTNYHVIRTGESAAVKTDDGSVFPIAGAIGIDRENDLALLAVEGKGFPYLPIGSVAKVEPGDRIVIIGSPLGLEGSVSEGIVAAKRKAFGQHEWLQITAAISHGSSGSPVLDSSGNVVGVATMLLKSGQSLNFAVPASAVERLQRHPLDEIQPISWVSYSYNREVWESPLMKAHHEAVNKAGMKENDVDMKKLKVDIARSEAWLKRYADAKGNPKKMEELVQEYDTGEKVEPAKRFRDLEGRERVYFLAKDLVAEYPDVSDTYGLLGQACMEIGLVEEAIAAYQEGNKIQEIYWYELGKIFRDSGREVLAKRAFTKKLERCQKTIDRLTKNLAWVKYPEEGHYQKSGALGNLGGVYELLGNSEAAKQAYLQAIREYETGKQTCLQTNRKWHHPIPDPGIFSRLVQIYLDEGNSQEAFNAAYRLMMLNPAHKDAEAEARDFVRSRRPNR